MYVAQLSVFNLWSNAAIKFYLVDIIVVDSQMNLNACLA